MNIIFLGAPGSGKGTQAALLSKDLEIPSISTGEILRNEVNNASEIGILAKSHMDSGLLVPDKLVVDIVKKRIAQNDCKNGFIIDGFPRNLIQGEMLDNMLMEVDKKIELVFNVEVPDEVIIKRLTGRFACSNCGTIYNRFFSLPKLENICDKCGGTSFINRDDDNRKTVENRLKVYHDNSKDLVKFYRKKNLLYSVDGLKGVASVFSDIKNKVH